MNKLRWATDGGFWELDVSTPVTLDGVARPVPGHPMPLGVSRGARLSRPVQADFFHRFMFSPVVPSFSTTHGLSLQRVISFPLGGFERWFGTLLAQFNVQKFVASIKENGFMQPSESSWLQSLGRHIRNKSFLSLDFSSELLLMPDDTLLLSLESSANEMEPRKKAILHHKFPQHNLTVEAAFPGLFIDKDGKYWDVPCTMAIDLASVASDASASYHMCMCHTAGSPKEFQGQLPSTVPPTLLSGFCAKTAFSFKKNVDIWKSEAPKLKMVQPYDIFLSNPHISLSGIIGAVITASVGENSARAQVEDESLVFKGLSLHARKANCAILTDLFASVSISAQHGNFQRLFLDLTRFYARLDFPSVSKFLSGTTLLANDLCRSQVPSAAAIQAICPDATLSFQQQIGGPFSFRVDSGVAINLENRERPLSMKDPVFAIEYALQVLGSAKAVAWYSPQQQEFMIELRFFEK